MIYLLFGDNPSAQDAKIEDLKKKILPQAQAAYFDLESFSAHKLTPENFKKSLISLPAVAPKRLLILRDADRLSPANQEILEEFIHSSPKHVDVILSFEEAPKETFLKKIKGPGVQIFDFSSGPKLNVFDMTRAIEMNKKAEALRILSELFEQGIHPLQIMGGLIWFWGKRRERVSPGAFEKGLLALQEADLNIKRSRLAPEHALEIVVVKLCSPLN